MDQDFQFRMNLVSSNRELMKLYVIQSKNGVIINIGVSVTSQMIEVFIKMIICGIIECMIVNAIKPVKLKNIWALKIVKLLKNW